MSEKPVKYIGQSDESTLGWLAREMVEYPRRLLASYMTIGTSAYTAVEHQEESRTCWCNPRVEQECPECHGGPVKGELFSCPRCNSKGWVPLYDEELPAVILHNDVPYA